ncbi:MAG: ABC transporter ATP-binding protein [Planctomycetota bacterium]
MIDPELEEMLARTRPSWQTFRRLLPFLRPHRRLLLVPLVIELFFCLAVAAEPHLIKVVFDDFIPAGRTRGVWIVAGLFVLLSASRAVMSAVQRTGIWTASARTVNDLRKWLFGHIQRLSMDYFDHEKQGRIIARVDRDSEFLRELLGDLPMLLVHMVFSSVLAAGFVASYDPRLLLVVFALAPVAGVAIWASNKWGLPAYRRVRRGIARLAANLAENVTGVHVVQAFGRERHNLGRFRTELDELRESVMTGALVRSTTFPAMMFVLGSGSAVVIAYANVAVPAGRMTTGEIAATIMYLGMIYGPLMWLWMMVDEILAASAAAERVVALMNRKPSIVDRPAAGAMPTIRGDVRFENVCFRYADEPDGPWILDEVSFEATPGQIVALVGSTGSGKSTILNLIPRFYEPDAGRITIDGVDIRDVRMRSLHEQMGIVLQENFLFTGTVMDNLKYGRPATTDDAAVAAAKALGSHEIIEGLADGYQTDVRERGGAISHGERQLICFTRAMIADPRILILDEATSAVDTETEILIQQALWKLMEGRTTFVAAHRLSTVRHADVILVIQNGRVVESGAHNELMRLGRIYANMFEEFVKQE